MALMISGQRQAMAIGTANMVIMDRYFPIMIPHRDTGDVRSI